MNVLIEHLHFWCLNFSCFDYVQLTFRRMRLFGVCDFSAYATFRRMRHFGVCDFSAYVTFSVNAI